MRSRFDHIGLLFLLWGLACAKKPATIESQTLGPIDSVTSGDNVEAEISSLSLELYSHISLANTPAYSDRFSHTRWIAAIGITPNQLVVGVFPPGLLRDRRVYRSYEPQWLAKNLQVSVCQQRDVAWVYDEASVRFIIRDKQVAFPVRVARVFVRKEGRWDLVLEHQTFPLPRDTWRAMMEADELAEAGTLGFSPTDATSSWFTDQLSALHNGVASEIQQDASSLIIFPDREERKGDQGDSVLSSWWGPGSKISIDQLHLDRSPGQGVIWATARLQIETELAKGTGHAAMIATYLLEKRDNHWHVLFIDASLPLTMKQIDGFILGD